MTPKTRSLFCTVGATLALALLTGAPTVFAQRWTWELPPERYKQFNMFERAQYDKTIKLFKDGNYAAAAAEFEKFQAQFQDSPAIPHIVFMRGYSLHLGKNRGAAIKAYTDVLDYFGNQVQDAGPALYFTGRAHLDNGDTREGLKVMKEMIEDEDYAKHPLAAGAYHTLGDNSYRNKDIKLALEYWKKSAALFYITNPEEAGACRDNVTDHYIKTRDYAAYDSWLVNESNRDNAPHRRWVCDNAWNRAWHGFAGDWDKYNTFNRDEKAKDMAAFWEWYKVKPEWYEKTNDPWFFYDRALHFVVQRLGDGKQRDALIEQAFVYIKKLKDAADVNGKYAFMIDRLREAGVCDRALYVAEQMTDRLHAEYKKYEIYARLNDWAKGVKCLMDLEASNNEHWRPRAQEERARIFKDNLARYEEAIKLYQEINKPPGTLWAIQECYKRWGKLPEALSMLTEIENSFPDQASEAAWYKAAYLDEAGRVEEAIGQARRILKVYPKSQASSRAHQLLEKHGIATGGGVTDEG